MSNYISQTYTYEFNDEQKEKIDTFIEAKPSYLKQTLKLVDNSYISKVKTYFKKIKKNNYISKDKYSFSDCGRMFSSDGSSIQGLSNEIRGYLFNGCAVDIDMKNAAFNFVRYILKTFFNEKQNDYKKLIDYSHNREMYFRNGFDKQDFISYLFNRDIKPKNYNSCDTDIKELIDEISKFKKLISNNLHFFNYIDFKVDGHIGQKLSNIIFTMENMLLQDILKEYKSSTIAPVFDGLILDNKINIENTLTHINEISNKYDITFINKEFPKIIFEESPPEYNSEYIELKKEFEKNHFIVEDPLQYIRCYESNEGKKITYYSKRDFMDIVAPYQIDGKPFFNYWLTDKDRKSFKKIEWYPNLEKSDENNFNTFVGFKGVKLEDNQIDMDSVNLLLNHISLLVNHEQDSKDYVIKYIADMFQRPEILPQTALLFKSEEGVGKDLFIDILGACLDKNLVHKEPKMENVLGTFNIAIKNKLIIQLNEVSGSDGFINKELLKDLITAEYLNIRKMRTDIELHKNYMRLFLFTNNKNPIEISSTDRRYQVFQAAKKESKDYYKILAKLLIDKNKINSIFSYFMNYDISEFTPHIDRVITQAYINIKNNSADPIYEFLYDWAKNPKKYSYKIQEKGDSHYIVINHFDVLYKQFLKEYFPYIEFKSKYNKQTLLDLGGIDKKISIDKKQYRGYQINLHDFIETLELSHNVLRCNDDIIELDSDSDIDSDSDSDSDGD
tara:strand:+ start:3693 stop:5876 length:2184 start_codon:yes stop_codon:yes gene_type:complete